MLVGICVRVKNEDIILLEFVAHYINLGFDKIHIYDNNSDKSVNILLEKLIKKYPGIITIENDFSNPNEPKWGQTNRYNEFLNANRKLDWILNCDADEFLYLNTHDNIKSFLSEFSDDTSVIPINWITFGTSKLEHFNPDKLVIEQFIYREDYNNFWNLFQKSLIRPNLITKIVNWHFHDSENYLTKNVYNEIIVKSSEANIKLIEKEMDRLNDTTPLVMIHYMTLDYNNMQKKHNKNKGFLISMDDNKYTREWYSNYFKDNNVDKRMYKYINNIKNILDN